VGFLIYHRKIFQHQVFKEDVIEPLLLFGGIATLLILVYLLIPVPSMSSNAEQASLNDFTFPTNSNSRSIPVLYGTVWVSGNIIYYNNLLSLKIKACS